MDRHQHNAGRNEISPENQPRNITYQRRENPYERGLRIVIGEMLESLLECIFDRNNPNRVASDSGVNEIAKRFIEILEDASKISDAKELNSLTQRGLKLVDDIAKIAILQARGEDKVKTRTHIAKQKDNLSRLLEALTDTTGQKEITAQELTACLRSTHYIDTPQKESATISEKKIPSEAALALLLGVSNLLEMRPILFGKCAAAAFGKPAQDPAVLTLQEFLSFVGRDSKCADPKLVALGDLGSSPGRIVTLVEPDSEALITCILVPKTSFSHFGDLMKASIEERLAQIDLPQKPASGDVWDLAVDGTHAVGIRFPLTQEDSDRAKDAEGLARVKELLRGVLQQKTRDVNLQHSHAVQVKLQGCESPIKIYMSLHLLKGSSNARGIVNLMNSALSLNPETEDALALRITRYPFRSKDNGNKERYGISWERTSQEASYLDRLTMLSKKGDLSEFWSSGTHVFVSLSSLHRANKSMMDALTSLSSKVSFGQVDPMSLFDQEDPAQQGKIFECLDELVSKFLGKKGEHNSSSKPLLFLEMSGMKRGEILVYLTDRNLSLMAGGAINTSSKDTPDAKLVAVSDAMSQRTSRIISELSEGIADLLASNQGNLSGLVDLFNSKISGCTDRFIVATWKHFLVSPRVPTKLDVLIFLFDHIKKDDLLT